MSPVRGVIFAVIAAFTVGSAYVSLVNAAVVVAPAERAALADLFVATDGAKWLSPGNWEPTNASSDPCANAWFGVTCDTSTSPAHVM